MTKSYLKHLLAELQCKRFSGLHDRQVVAYVRMYCAVYNLISNNSLDDEWGDRMLYGSKLKTLSRILWRRIGRRGDVVSQARLLDTLFYLLYNLPIPVNRDLEEKCWKQASSLVDDYIEGFSRESCRHGELAYVLRLIAVLWYGWVKEVDDEEPVHLEFARRIIGDWMGELSEDGCWERISDPEGLERTMVLAVLSDLIPEIQAEEELLRKIYVRYCVLKPRGGVGVSPDGEVERAVLMYEVLQQSPILSAPDYLDGMGRISLYLEKLLKQNIKNATLRTLCEGVVLDYSCWQVSEEAQQALFAADNL